MKIPTVLLVASAVWGSLKIIRAQPGKSSGQVKPMTIASVLDAHLGAVERNVISAVEAMPEEKFSFAPNNGEFKGVRTFAQQVKHIAVSNNQFFGAILGQKFDVAAARGEGPDTLKTKEEILQYLRDSYALGHRAIATITSDNAVELLSNWPKEDDPQARFLGTRLGFADLADYHAFDYYGQMLEYLRMNGIVPPNSRGQKSSD